MDTYSSALSMAGLAMLVQVVTTEGGRRRDVGPNNRGGMSKNLVDRAGVEMLVRKGM